MTPTETMLLAVHRTPVIPLRDVCDKLFGLGYDEARRQATLNTLPVPTWRAVGSQKGPLLIYLTDLARFIDNSATTAQAAWAKSQL